MPANENLNKSIFYAGSDAFSIQPLQRLLNLKYKRITVLTGPPKRQGRGMKIKNNPLAEYAAQHDLETFMPINPNDNNFLVKLAEKKPDALITSAYGKILSETFLDSFCLGNINIHPSLLPRWRGPSPIESALLEGDKTTGVSLIQMTHELDAGPIYQQKSIKLSGENSKTLSKKLSMLSADMIQEFLPVFLDGNANTKCQDENFVTYSKTIKKEHARIDWNETSQAIDKKIKAYYPWPVAHTYLDDKYLRIWDSEALVGDEDKKSPGEIVEINKEGVIVKCSGSKIILKGVQPEGKKEMLAADFARGNKLGGRRFS